MNIRPVSDLHLEFDDARARRRHGKTPSFDIPLDGVDVLVLAGDLHNGTSILDRVRKWAKQVPVIMVLGNHEFWGEDFYALIEEFRSVDIPNFHFLENDSVVIAGVRFLGCTLWTDLKRADPLVCLDVEGGMNDYDLIWEGSRKLLPMTGVDRHLASRQWLESKLLGELFAGPTVVVTHHLPCSQVVHRQWRGDPLSFAYHSTDCDALIVKANCWIFGHQHNSVDEMVGGCRMVSNPRGYVPGGPNLEFDVAKTIEILT